MLRAAVSAAAAVPVASAGAPAAHGFHLDVHLGRFPRPSPLTAGPSPPMRPFPAASDSHNCSKRCLGRILSSSAAAAALVLAASVASSAAAIATTTCRLHCYNQLAWGRGSRGGPRRRWRRRSRAGDDPVAAAAGAGVLRGAPQPWSGSCSSASGGGTRSSPGPSRRRR